ncbi:PstS family phosphate ABC transporter substrate-binding protein [Anoxynatronum sibiricum]|uniref:Phosphate-binding protein n=1 Tax=Anoxynatronum sibiricum TaxID=210623 RepID=A0ABU9VSC0_9CLOT
MKKMMSLLMVLMVAASLLAGCGQSEPAPAPASTPAPAETPAAAGTSSNSEVDFSEMIEVKGSDTMVNLGQAWAEAFMDAHPEALISVTGGGSGTGAAAVINGTAHLAQMSRAMKEDEFAQAEAAGNPATEIVAGRDGIVVAVHVDNPVEALTMDEIKDIYTGVITNWSEVGGADRAISLFSRDTSSGTYAFFKEFVLDDEEYSPEAMLMPSTQAIVEGLIQDVGGIGYIGLGYLTDDVKPVPVAQEAGAEAFLPSLETINAGDYPVARPLFLYTAGEATPALQTYVDFILGTEGQKIVEDLGFVPLQ